jgi:hypothetical protein
VSKAIEEVIIGTTIEMSKTVAAPNADKVLGMAPAAGEEVEGDSDVDEPPAIDHRRLAVHFSLHVCRGKLKMTDSLTRTLLLLT